MSQTPLPSREGKSTPRVLKVKKKRVTRRGNTPRTQVRDFIPWVHLEFSRPPDSEGEEEEEMTGLLNRYATRKRKRQEDAARGSDAAPYQDDESSRPATGSSLEEQVIIIPGSPETRSNDRPDIGDDVLGESGEAASTPSALQMIPPPVQVGSRSGRSEFTRIGLKKLPLPDQIPMNSYLPVHSPTSPKEEVSVPGLEDVKYIVRHWKPFNRGESAADGLNSLYPMMLRMPMASRANCVGEDYFVTVPAGTNKEDLQQIIDDRIQIRNRNYIQSSELVR